MSKKRLTWLSAGIAVLVGTVFAGGCHRHRWHNATPEKRAEWMVERISDKLDLTENQKLKLDQIKDEMLVKQNEFSGFREDIYADILSQVKSERVDVNKLNSSLEQKEEQFQEMRTFMVTKFSEFHAVLTPEQRDKLAEKMKKLHDRFSRH